MAGRAWTYKAALLLVLFSSACSPAAPDNEVVQNVAMGGGNQAAARPVQTPAADGKLVVAFGDSLFAGYNLGRDEGFAPALERQLAEQGIAATVFNAAVSGDATQAARQRLGFALDGLARTPDLVIVGLGGNDMLRGLSPQETRANLHAILTELRRRDMPVLLTGMVAAPNMGADYARAFNPIYPELAREFGVPLYPFLLEGVIANRQLLLDDGIHPNPRGVETIVDRVGPLAGRALATSPDP